MTLARLLAVPTVALVLGCWTPAVLANDDTAGSAAAETSRSSTAVEHAVSRETNFRHHLKRLVHQRDLARKMDNPERAKQLDTLLTEIKKRHVERTRNRHRAMNTADRAQFDERVSRLDDERQNQRANNAGTRSTSERARRSNAWDHRRAKRTERRNAWSDRRSQHRDATSDRRREKRSRARANTRTVRFDLHTNSTAGSKARPKNAKTSRLSKSDVKAKTDSTGGR